MEKQSETTTKYRYIIGIDEAGRGPLAGPIAVGAVLIPIEFNIDLVKGVRDSKKLSLPLREKWFLFLRHLESAGELTYRVSFVSASIIDKRGITFAVHKAIRRCLERFEVPAAECLVLLDGGLRAPQEFDKQRTIIGGDDIEPVISLAAIAAKVTRDRRMTGLARKYPLYDFEIHKGYGTKDHYRKIKRHGISPIHRKSFLQKFAGKHGLTMTVDAKSPQA